MQAWELDRDLGRALEKLDAIKAVTEPFIERGGRFWKVKMMLHYKHREYVSEIMNILDGQTSSRKETL